MCFVADVNWIEKSCPIEKWDIYGFNFDCFKDSLLFCNQKLPLSCSGLEVLGLLRTYWGDECNCHTTFVDPGYSLPTKIRNLPSFLHTAERRSFAHFYSQKTLSIEIPVDAEQVVFFQIVLAKCFFLNVTFSKLAYQLIQAHYWPSCWMVTTPECPECGWKRILTCMLA